MNVVENEDGWVGMKHLKLETILKDKKGSQTALENSEMSKTLK